MSGAADTDTDKDGDMYLLICTYLSGGTRALRNIDPRSCRESFNMCSLLKKYNIKVDDSPDANTITLRQFVSRCPLLVAYALHKTSGKIVAMYGTIRGLPESLMFPWAINMIPTSPSWETMRVLWKMWKESYPSSVVEKSSRGEYMRLNYVFDGVYNREKIMTQFGIKPPSPDYVVRKIDAILERYGYGDNFTAFEIIFATSALDIWNFYETYSGAYSFVDFSRCPEMEIDLTNVKPLDLTIPKRPDLVSPESKTSTSRDEKVISGSEQRKSSVQITTVCFDEFNELKSLVASFARESKQTELKMETDSRDSESDLQLGLKSKVITERSTLNGEFTGKESGQKFRGGGVTITVCQKEPQNLTVRPKELSNRSPMKFENGSEPSMPGSWEYRLLRETVMLRNGEKTSGTETEFDQKQIGKCKRSVFQEDCDSTSRESVIRNIVRLYFIQNQPPRNFSCDSPTCFVFPELPVLKSYSRQKADFQPFVNTDLHQYNKTSEVEILLDCSLARMSEQKSKEMSRNSVVEKQEVEQRDVFVKPKTPPLRKVLPRKEAVKKEEALSIRQNHINNFNSLKDFETKKQGAFRKNGCPRTPAVKTNGLLKSSRTSELGSSQNNLVSTKVDVIENGCAGSQKTADSDKNLVKNTDCYQETKDRDGLRFDSPTVIPVGDSSRTHSSSSVFKAGCSGDAAVDLEIEIIAKELMPKHPDRLDSKCKPFSEKENAEVPMDIVVESKSSDVTEVKCPPRSRIHNTSGTKQDGASKSLEIRNSAFDLSAAEEKSPGKKQTKLPNFEYSRVSQSTKRMNNSDDAKLAHLQDGFMMPQSSVFMTSSAWEAQGDRLLLAAIKEFLPPPPPFRSNQRRLTKQMLNVMRARGAWQTDRQKN